MKLKYSFFSIFCFTRRSFSEGLLSAYCRLPLRSALCLLLLTLAACNNPSENIPDVSSIKVSLQTYRFDEDFSSLDTNHIGEALQKLHTKYPDFLNYYLDTFQAFGFNGNYYSDSLGVQDSLKECLSQKDLVNLEDTIKKYYPDTKDIDAELTQGFQFMKYYFPHYHIRKILYMNMYLAKFPAFAWDSNTLCVGLDWFLGAQYPYYPSVGVPSYNLAHMRKSYLPVSVFNTLYKDVHPFIPTDKTLLDLMILRGKEQYFLHKILPHTADSVLFGYADHKLKWCSANEGLIYNFFIHQGLLYNKEPQNIMPYINDGPFAVNFPDANVALNTPGNIGTWLGYRIVCSYMEQNPSMTLRQLLDQQPDAAQFLDAAKYRPK